MREIVLDEVSARFSLQVTAVKLTVKLFNILQKILTLRYTKLHRNVEFSFFSCSELSLPVSFPLSFRLGCFRLFVFPLPFKRFPVSGFTSGLLPVEYSVVELLLSEA